MTQICLIRHGETDWNAETRLQGKTDIPLNETGIKQAQECRDFLVADEWDVLITSPLKRARQTADIINEALKLPIVEMAEFAEKGFGDAEGMTLEERREAFPNKNYPNEESLSSFSKRLFTGIDKVTQMYKNGNVLLVAHGAVIGTILGQLSDGEIDAFQTPLLNACISNIHMENEKWLIKNYNQVFHLTSKKE